MPPAIEHSSPEKRLLVCCARTRMNRRAEEEIRKLLSGPIEWDFLLDAARDNSVTPLLWRNLSALTAGGTRAAEMARLEAATRANVVRCMALAGELFKVMEALGSRGITAIPYKGPVLGAQAYGDMTLREFEDLDIVLPQREMTKAHEAMSGLGYRPKFPGMVSHEALRAFIPGEYAYRDGTGRVVVELHTERTLRHFPVAPNVEALAARAVAVSLEGRQLRTFAPEDGLPILAVHGAKDFWERIGWVADIAEMIRAHPGVDWDAAWRRAEALGARRMLSLALALAAGLLRVALPTEVARRVGQDGAAAEIAAEVQRRLLSRQVHPRTASERFHFRRRMAPGALEGWRYATRLAFTPADEDWQGARPPHVAQRPLRLWQKHRQG